MGIAPLDRAFFLERPLPFLLFLPVTSLGGGHACPFRWFGSRGWDVVWWDSCFASCGGAIVVGIHGLGCDRWFGGLLCMPCWGGMVLP